LGYSVPLGGAQELVEKRNPGMEAGVPPARAMLLRFFLVTCGLTAAMAQPVSFGVKGGLLGADVLDASSRGPAGESRDYTIGPTFEVSLPSKLAFAVDVCISGRGTPISVALSHIAVLPACARMCGSCL
jgi:hypothetical protein